MSSTKIEITIDRISRTFLPGQVVRGNVTLTTKTTLKVTSSNLRVQFTTLVQFEGLDLHLDGQLSTQKNQLLADNFSSSSTNISKPHVILGSCVSLLPAGKLNVGVKNVPFSFELRSTTGLDMMETYHGAHVLVNYILK